MTASPTNGKQEAIEALQAEVAALKVRVSKLEGGRGQ